MQQPTIPVSAVKIPPDIICPITHEIMTEPVVLVESGHTYEREALLRWLEKNTTDPATGVTIQNKMMAPNITLKKMIESFLEEYKKVAPAWMEETYLPESVINSLIEAIQNNDSTVFSSGSSRENLIKAASLLPGEADYQAGNFFYMHGHYQLSLSHFEKAASQNYPAAYLRLWRLCQGDQGIPKDEQKRQRYVEQIGSTFAWFEGEAKEGGADAQTNLGRCYQNGLGVKQDVGAAVKYFQLAADQGYALAQFNLGWCYLKGEGVEKNAEQAMKYYQLAAVQGHAMAQFNLGICYAKGEGVAKNMEQALKYYQMAANQGYARAQVNLGICYENGEGVAKNMEQALKYYQLAADQGHATAQFNLGVYYAKGEGVAKNMEQALKYYQLAANQGYARAQFNLGVCYENGEGVAKNMEQALKYYQLAADQGHARAQVYLGVCYENGEGVAKNMEQARKYYQLAADQGYALAQFNLGLCYLKSAGVEKNKEQGVRYLQLAANQGHAEAQVNLGVYYAKGEGVTKNMEQAIKYYQLAADQGHARAQVYLGICYYIGEGVAKNIEQAMKYYRLAADGGSVDAKTNLENLLKQYPYLRYQQNSPFPKSFFTFGSPSPNPLEADTADNMPGFDFSALSIQVHRQAVENIQQQLFKLETEITNKMKGSHHSMFFQGNSNISNLLQQANISVKEIQDRAIIEIKFPDINLAKKFQNEIHLVGIHAMSNEPKKIEMSEKEGNNEYWLYLSTDEYDAIAGEDASAILISGAQPKISLGSSK